METQMLTPTPGRDYPRTWNEFLDWFATEEACQAFLEKLRWPQGFVCPRCGNAGDVYRASRTRLMCRSCQYQGTVTSGTIFDKTRTPLRVWLAAAWYLTNQKQGVSALGLQRVLGLGSYQTAWTMLDELEGGRMPTFQYRDWYRQDRPVRVSLSSVNFRVKYQAFMDCLSGLLPYSFNDIAFSVLSYDKNSDQLSPASKRRLAMIGDYVKADKSIDVVVIDAYSDSYGGRWPNQKLSEKRADAIKQVFVDLGIEEGKISVEGHGEKQHVASNETEAGRAKNRRVVINMGRNDTI